MEQMWIGAGIGLALGLPIFLVLAGVALVKWSERNG